MTGSVTSVHVAGLRLDAEGRLARGVRAGRLALQVGRQRRVGAGAAGGRLAARVDGGAGAVLDALWSRGAGTARRLVAAPAGVTGSAAGGRRAVGAAAARDAATVQPGRLRLCRAGAPGRR